MHTEPAAETEVAQSASPLLAGKWRWLLLLVLLLLAGYNLVSVLPGTVLYGARGAADFSIFYTGATIIKQGLSPHLYDLAVQAHFQSPFYRVQPLPFNHLAYELLIFLPMASLPFTTAFWLWNAMNLTMLAAFAKIISPFLRNLFRPTAVLAFIAALAFFPVVTAFSGGQDSILLLLIFTIVYALFKSKKDLLAGLVLATGLFKFPMVLPFVLPFLLRRQWEFVRGFAVGSALVLTMSVAITGFSGFGDYVLLLAMLTKHPEIGYIAPAQMPDVRGFLFSVLPHSPMLLAVVAAAISIALLAFATKSFCSRRDDSFDIWFTLNLIIASLVSPHLYRHDLSPLLLAILLCWNTITNRKTSWHLVAALSAITFVLLATPLYEVLSDRGCTSYFFLPLWAFSVAIAFVSREQRSAT
jgi:alpha-1,2-mannosyltransferase